MSEFIYTVLSLFAYYPQLFGLLFLAIIGGLVMVK